MARARTHGTVAAVRATRDDTPWRIVAWLSYRWSGERITEGTRIGGNRGAAFVMRGRTGLVRDCVWAGLAIVVQYGGDTLSMFLLEASVWPVALES